MTIQDSEYGRCQKQHPPLDKIDAVLNPPRQAPTEISSECRIAVEPRLPPGTTNNLMLSDQANLASIAGSVLRASAGPECRTLLVTSANAGEGKTTIASNIAYSLARQAGARTIIVDANLHSPRLHDLFEVDPAPGMTSLLLNQLEPESILHATDQNNLFMMALGKSEQGFLSIFNPTQVRYALEQLARLFHVVIFDGPPIFGPSDPAIIASSFNHVFLVAECERTRWEVMESAKERIQNAGGPISGVILNRRKHYIPKYLYNRVR